MPIIYTISLAYQDPSSSDISYGSQASNFEFLATVNGILFMAIGSVIGYPLASAAGKTSNQAIFILLLTTHKTKRIIESLKSLIQNIESFLLKIR